MLTLLPASRAMMPFRQALLADPDTMAYNAPWFPPDGTIPFPESRWDDWLGRWTNREPERFCGYLLREDGTPVGEICWHSYGADMGVVIHAPFRGQGYGEEGLHLLIDRAFSHREIPFLENTFEPGRSAALALHRKLGFLPVSEQNGLLTLRLTRNE